MTIHTETGQSPELDEWAEAGWRALTLATAAAYLAPDFEPRQRVTALKIARQKGLRPPEGVALIKTERYALAAAAIRKIAGHWVEGTGKEARIRPQWLQQQPPFTTSDPFNNMSGVLCSSYHNAACDIEQDRRSHVAWFLGRYSRLSTESCHATAGLIRIGGTMPMELKYYTRTTARSFSETPLTKGFDEGRRIRIAHQMLPLLTARASQHIDSVLDGPQWFQVEHTRPHIREITPKHQRDPGRNAVQAAHREALYQLLGPDGAALFPLAMQIREGMAPLLKCPAHQRIWGTESALQIQLHAGVNYAGDQGLYRPDFTVPAPSSTPAPSR